LFLIGKVGNKTQVYMTLKLSETTSLSQTTTGNSVALFAKGYVDPPASAAIYTFQLKIDGVTVDETQQYTTNITNNNIEFALLYSTTTLSASSHTITITNDSHGATINQPKILLFEEVSGSGGSGSTTTVEGTITIDNPNFDLFSGILLFFSVVAFFTFFFRRSIHR